jgi:hypothetical protein
VIGRPIEWIAARERRFVRNWKQAHVEAKLASGERQEAEEVIR